MAVNIAFRVEAPAWRGELPKAGPLVRRAARAALASAEQADGIVPAGDLCVVLADDELQRQLNRDYRGRDKPTNVLSFDGAPAALGDVVLALETVAAEAQMQGKPLADHVAHLVVHGVLHLMGYDHEKRSEASRMERLEIEILERLGVANPYVLTAAYPPCGPRRPAPALRAQARPARSRPRQSKARHR
jgi:probable rRNA maturation factor